MTDSVDDLTYIGADLSAGSSRRLSYSNAFSGFISQFSFWFGLVTVPFSQKNLALPCIECTTCLSTQL